MRSSESIDTPGASTESLRRSTAVEKVLQSAALAYVALMAQPAAAADQQEQRPVSVAPATVEIEPPFIHFDRLLDEAVDAFKDDSYSVRNDAFQALKTEIDDGITKTNPLPKEIFVRLEEKRTPDLLPEQDERFRQLLEHARLQEQLNPLRIRCPKAEGKSLAQSLGERFELPILPEDPKIAAAIQYYQEGGEGQTYAGALRLLCDEFECVPEIRPYGLVLRQDPNASFRLNEYLLIIDRKTPKGIRSEVSILPNYGVLQGSVLPSPLPDLQMTTTTEAPWRMDSAQIVSRPHRTFNLQNDIITYWAAINPETVSIEAQEGSSATIGLQTFYIESIEENKDGLWTISIKGNWSGLDFGPAMKISDEETRVYQMTAATGYTVETDDGTKIGCPALDLAFDHSKFNLKLLSPSNPRYLEIRAFKQYQSQIAPLP